MMVHRHGCNECGTSVDLLSQEGDLACNECGEPLEFLGTVGSVRGLSEGQIAKGELEQQIAEWRGDESVYSHEKYWIQHTANECADDIEELLQESENE